MPAPRYGSLCSGYGGLDHAVAEVFGAEPAFHAEVDPAAAAVLAHRVPGVPNFGDITTVDWHQVPDVDVLCAGYPCQPMSFAGTRKGLDDERWLWPAVARAIRVLRPRWVLLENVPGHCATGFGSVLADLATSGFDAEWLVLAASDLGAAHQRKRLFLLAWPADPARERRRERPLAPPPARVQGRPGDPPGPTAPDPQSLGAREPADHTVALPTRRDARPLARRGTLLPTPCASDGAKGGPHQTRSGQPALSGAVHPPTGAATPRPSPHTNTSPDAPRPTRPNQDPTAHDWPPDSPNGSCAYPTGTSPPSPA